MKEEAIRKYFNAWLNADISELPDIFADDIIYSECYGPEYRGIEQLLRWFKDWSQKGKVLEWTIKRVIENSNILIAEWYFKCDYMGDVSCFDGVTIAEFNDDIKISKLSEFQSKSEHYFPYS